MLPTMKHLAKSRLKFNLTRPPGLGEEWLERTVEPQYRKPALFRVGLNPISAFHAFWLLRADKYRRRAVGGGFGSRTGIALAAGPREPLWRLQHRARLIVVQNERPERAGGNAFGERDLVGLAAVVRVAVGVREAN